MRFSSFALAIALQLSLSAAWPWPPSFENLNLDLGLRRREADIIPDERDIQLRAAASTTSASAAAAATTNSGASSTAASKTGKAQSSASGTAAASTAAKSASGTAPPSNSSASSASQSIPINAPAGGFSMVTPVQTSATYAKIGKELTFVWNYTSLIATPSYVDIVATNTDGVWTIAQNVSAKETSVVWNTSNEATPLPMESYTFVIYDTEAGVTAVPSPGHLSPYLGYQFAMYSPQPATSGAAFYCVTCNGAITSIERQSLKVLFGTCLITILSFTYFSCGFLGII